VVDDAIIDVENIGRRLRLNHEAGGPKSAWEVVFEASLEVRSAVVYATFIVILVFLPVFFLEGVAGAFFRPLAISYILAVGASLGVALTVTPALALLLLPGSRLEHHEPRLTSWLRGRYRALLPTFIEAPRLSLAAIAVLLIVAVAAVPFLGEEFLPKFKEYDFLMHWVEKPGTSLEAMQRITVRASKELRSIPGVRNFGAHIGRAEVADEVVGPNFTELWISLDPKVPYEPAIARIQGVVDGYPGLYRDLLTYLKERIKEVISGGSAAVVVRLYGPNLDTLRTKAREVAQSMGQVQGVADLQVEPQVEIPQIEIDVRQENASRFGLHAGDIRRTVTTLVKGAKVGEIYEDQKIFDVAVWGVPALRAHLSSLEDILIDTPAGARVPLRDLAQVRFASVPNVVQHENGSRRLDVSCNVRGRDLGSVARDIEQRIRGVAFDREYHAELLGEYTARQESRQRLLLLSVLSLFGILIILHADFKSLRLALLVVASLPFALVGGVLGAFMTGGVLSLGSLVGFVTVLGIASRNGIMLISHYRHLEQQEGIRPGRELIIRGSEERLAPILMTALATGLALLPIVIGGEKPGHEIEYPMAVVILGGLFTSTLLNLLFTPVLFARFGQGAAR
ncbi:MAG: efflux RND transporter permease subunit, partial [Bryobacteraceae bacterium]